ncbi:GNAT family N-acetyltransferase [Fusobacterium sp.]|uniref:GNAT family N-acetyltransferase n=1 Tax=Fusobacterium sp. TaxID=68766 RepID=UPI00396C8F80
MKKYEQDFKCISYEWLNDYSILEKADVEMIENFESVILREGGHMFFAILYGKAVGTLSLLKINEGVYELAKFGVDKEYRGKGIGEMLLTYVVNFSLKKGYKKLLVHTMSILKPSINLYKKLRFKEMKNIKLSEKSLYELTDLTFYRILV